MTLTAPRVLEHSASGAPHAGAAPTIPADVLLAGSVVALQLESPLALVSALTALSSAGAVPLVLALLEVVAATALIASLLLLVRRKKAEIAALMALGADGRAVFWIFEAVGLLAGAVGALVGVLLGLLLSGLVALYRYPLSSDVYPVEHLPVRLTALDVLLPGLAAVLLCGLVSGPVALIAAKQPLLPGLRR